MPRLILVLPRSGFALPRFAAVLGFTFPHPTGLFTPVAAFCRDPRFRALHFMWVFTPVAAAPAHPRFAWARTVYPRCKRNAKSPQPPKVPRSPLSQTATRCNNQPRRPAFRCRPWSCPASVPIAGNDSRRQARIAEADRRRPREAQTTPDTRLIVRGVVPTTIQSDLPLTRAAARLAPQRGANQWIWGDARRKAVNRARQFFRQARLNEKRRARFWVASPTASPPSFAENPLEARSTHLRQDEHTLRPRPAPDGTSKGNFGNEQGTNNRARGVGVQISLVGGTRTHEPTPPRRGATHNSALVGDCSRTCPSARRKRNWRGVCGAITQPQTPPRRAFGATTKWGRIRGRFSHNAPKGAARRG